ncbi:zinc ABC transporter substrate-binding protein [Paenibacillus sp. IB182496]|uniref:Zinc ABC transporter substrate-binding protein n=1 Tax=Paenibacillus sabuli TaxID=2772509 RepID=A0A927BWH5_9BACL|nr:metal ABC transporter substrate-binding protein [Paenibacillus sabuli]MBD2846744.1 zinc ABC transporter substrate-binding protein [Paenibacillus sabuli]
MRATLKTAAAVFGAAVLLAGCGGNNAPQNNAGNETNAATNATDSAATGNSADKLQIVASFYPMYNFASEVGGDHADVINLVPAGVEPHDWEPSAKDMAKLQEADVFVYNGGVEGWVPQALESAPNADRLVVEASSGIELMEGSSHSHSHGEEEDHAHEEEHEHEDDHAHEDEQAHEDEHEADHADNHGHEDEVQDPHVWLSPALAQLQVQAIADALAEADPEHAADYQRNAEQYIAELEQLDADFRNALEDAPRTEIVTQHSAFGYLAREYGLTQLPISGLSPDQEPSPARMAEIVELSHEHDVTTIFFETLVDPKIAETIASEIGAETAVLNPLEGLTQENLDNGEDYISVMRHNLEALQKALTDN